MITRTVRIQLIVFAALTLVGTALVGLRYVGLADKVLGTTYLVSADFTTAAVGPNASVTYRGVPIGRVESVSVRADGVRVHMRLQKGIPIPRDLRVVTANRSAIGEQHVDLRPNTEAGPYLKPGEVIPVSRTGVPLPVEELVYHLDQLATSVNPDDLAVVIDELGQAFQGNEEALGRLLEAGDLLLTDAQASLPETIALIRDGRTVLETQEVQGDAIREWANNLALLTKTFAESDGDLRRVIVSAPPAALETVTLLRDLDPNIGILLGNMITVNGIMYRRIDSVQAFFVALPLVVGGTYTVASPGGDRMTHLGLALNFDYPPPCVYTPNGQRTERGDPNSDAFAGCTDEELAAGSSVRGWQNLPERPGPEISPAPIGGGTPPQGSAGDDSATPGDDSDDRVAIASYDPVTGMIIGPDGQPLQLGMTGGQYALLGAQSWKELLYAGISV